MTKLSTCLYLLPALLLLGCVPVKEDNTAVQKTHIITALAGSGGLVSPSGDVPVEEGSGRAFAIVADMGYQVRSVSVDGVDVGARTGYTFENVRAPHALAVRFEPEKKVEQKSASKAKKSSKKSKAESVEPVQSKPVETKAVEPEKKHEPVSVKAIAAPQEVVVQPSSKAVEQPVVVAPAVIAPEPQAVVAAEPAPIAKVEEPSPAPQIAPAQPEPVPTAQKEEPREPAAAVETVARQPITPVADLVRADMSAENQGLAVVREAKKRDQGFADFRADILMTLSNANGDEVMRYISYSTLEAADDGDKSLISFNRPADVAGTALLTHGHRTSSDDQWLYLPAIKRVKRISSSNKSGSFMGSEFSYEDLSAQEVEKYKYKWIKDDACGDRQCFLIEAYPADEKSGYVRQERWIDKQDLLVRKINYYDRKNELLKTLEMSGYQQYLGRYWRAADYLMRNHQNGKATKLEWKNYQFHAGLTAAQFQPNALEQ